MCIDDNLERRYMVLQLPSNETQFVLSIPENRYLVKIELAGYQIAGAPIVAGVPVSPAYYAAFESLNFPTEMIATNNGTPLAGVSGIPLQLDSSFTSRQYDTPRIISRRYSSQPGLPCSVVLNVKVRDETGALAQMTWARIYCYLVYDKSSGLLDYSASSIRAAQKMAGGII